jgi:hypothetical protein
MDGAYRRAVHVAQLAEPYGRRDHATSAAAGLGFSSSPS